ncbi:MULTISPECIES: DUF6883 domain-containing protein [Methylobacterium]|uniref:DUF6883 domain-containing protein n=1 Tax=Methylobacterium thuringiense TaxID=1003091 RepID=A0ABQ4TMB6_9HYPH|nr:MULTISPECIES: DUF6883 domain-containing protein [Methylobacterium]TXN21616.1 hypothetical protein FV217_13750 [Methylobacterium sp. WL9]GJE55737.1 hypothetical protein EKPJFOCH_2232 [Methylobacterium thuringiense]
MTGDLANPRLFATELGKVTEFLLNPSHEDNKGRAKFLMAFGFTVGDPLKLLQAINLHPAGATLIKAYAAPHGRKFHYEGRIASPDGTNPNVRTVWQIDFDGPSDIGRFITLKPLDRLPDR